MNVSNTAIVEHFKSKTGAEWASLLVLTIVTALLYNSFFFHRAYVEFDIDVTRPTVLKMMWADKTETSYLWTKKNDIRVGPQRSHYSFFIGDLRKIYSIRFYPATKVVGDIVIRNITINQPGIQEQVFETAEDFKRFVPGWDVKKTDFAEDTGWTVVPSGRAPHFHLIVDPTPVPYNVVLELGRFLGILLIFYIVFSFFSPWVKQHRYVCWLAFAVFILAVVMAVISLDNQHPDERVHVLAADYYVDHWMIPAINSPEISHTFSPYGFSRLNSKEICYFIAGKFSWLLDNFNLNTFQRYRFFNVMLLGVLVLMTFRNLTARLLFIPLLMTSQVWYVFSYYNSDVFTLFVDLLAAYQLVYKKSLFNRFLQGNAGSWQAALILGPLVGILLLLKKNNYFYLLFIVGYVLLSFLRKRPGYTMAAAKKLVLIACVGVVLVGVRYVADVQVNGFNKREQIFALSTTRARKIYNSNTPLAERSPNYRIRARGVTLEQFLDEYKWADKITRSFYGVYGYLTVRGSWAYYSWMRNTGFLFVAFIGLMVIFRGGWWENGVFFNTIVCAAALICGTCYFAWARDFQAQGRYLLPMMPMLGILIVETKQIMQPLIFRSFVILMFLMSGYNFIFIGLRNIAKYG